MGRWPPTPAGWSDTDWIKHLQRRGPHPLAGQHINRGSMDAAADAHEAEYNEAQEAETSGARCRNAGLRFRAEARMTPNAQAARVAGPIERLLGVTFRGTQMKIGALDFAGSEKACNGVPTNRGSDCCMALAVVYNVAVASLVVPGIAGRGSVLHADMSLSTRTELSCGSQPAADWIVQHANATKHAEVTPNSVLSGKMPDNHSAKQTED